MEPKISVIVIGYNIEEYIEKCIESILSQSFTDFETIFVNDGSKDQTLQIASKYKDNIKIVDKPNGGIVSARKAGLKKAVGEYITFVDGDDWLNVDCLKNLYAPILYNPNLDIVCSDYFKQNKEQSFNNAKSNRLNLSSCKEYEFFTGIITDEIDHHMFPKLYRRDFVLQAGYLEYPEVTMAEDWMTNSFLGLYKPNVAFSNSTNYFYRFNVNSASRKGGKNLLEEIKTQNYMEEFFRQQEVDYAKYMDFVRFAYTREYLLGNTESSVKIKIAKAFKGKKIDYKNNEYCIKNINRLSKRRKIKFQMELAIPSLAPFFDYACDSLEKYKIKRKEKENKDHEDKMEPVYNGYIDKLKKDKSFKNAYIIGTSDRSNVGDHAIAFSELKLLKEILPEYHVAEITGDTFRKRRDEVKSIINAGDVLFITGGGFLGDLWPDEERLANALLEDYPDNKIIILPQTVYFYDDADSRLLREKIKNYLCHKNLYLIARDRKTFDFFGRYFEKNKVGLYPDMALYIDGIDNADTSNSVMLCLRKDKEHVLTKDDELLIRNVLKSKGYEIEVGSTLSTGVHNGDIILGNREQAIKTKLEEFSKQKIIITDRLHGMILSTLAGTPCIVFDNLSKKVTGVYDLWLKKISTIHICYKIDQMDELIDLTLKQDHFIYSSEYLEHEKEKFKEFIVGIVREQENVV